jgi:hypothetical protein
MASGGVAVLLASSGGNHLPKPIEQWGGIDGDESACAIGAGDIPAAKSDPATRRFGDPVPVPLAQFSLA